ncbi:hypothetical protein D3C87_1184000 [compost metagenome]
MQLHFLDLTKRVEVCDRRSAVDQQLLIAFCEDLDAAPVLQIRDDSRLAFDDHRVARTGSARLAGDELNRQRLFRVYRRAFGQGVDNVQGLLDLVHHVTAYRPLAGGMELRLAVLNLNPRTDEVSGFDLLLEALLEQEVRCSALVGCFVRHVRDILLAPDLGVTQERGWRP